MVNCQQVLELMGDFVDNDLNLQSRMRLRLHLLMCRYCRHYFSSYRTTIQAEKNSFFAVDGPVASEIPSELIAAILAEVHRLG